MSASTKSDDACDASENDECTCHSIIRGWTVKAEGGRLGSSRLDWQSFPSTAKIELIRFILDWFDDHCLTGYRHQHIKAIKAIFDEWDGKNFVYVTHRVQGITIEVRQAILRPVVSYEFLQDTWEYGDTVKSAYKQ